MISSTPKWRHSQALPFSRKEDIQLCQEIKKLKQDLHQLSALPEKEKCAETQEKEAKLIEMIQKQVEKRDYLVDDMEFERLREYEEDCEMSEFLQKKLKKKEKPGKTGNERERLDVVPPAAAKASVAKAGLNFLKNCCGVVLCCLQ
uniref:bMERB domain-containing protein 1-like isoform X2 n=1 Tax=Myxine glutinosa TaxID=7769 RepID=UPI00358DDB50